MSRAKYTGKTPGTQPCPRCGKHVSAWWNGRFTVYPKHNRPDGKRCRREDAAPRADLDVGDPKKRKVAS